MVKRKRVRRKKAPSWDKLGKMIGSKVGKEINEKKPFEKHWMYCSSHDGKGGGFGRLLFIIALLFILSGKGYLDGVAAWQIVLLVLGFAMMKL